jgi:hypothetical protein
MPAIDWYVEAAEAVVTYPPNVVDSFDASDASVTLLKFSLARAKPPVVDPS